MKVTVPALALGVALLVGHLYFGMGYALGPPRLTSSGSFAVALTWFTQQQWGWSILAGALLSAAAPWLPWWGSVTAHAAAAVPLLGFSVAIGLAELRELAQGWGGLALFLIPVAAHVLLIHARLHHRHEGARLAVA